MKFLFFSGIGNGEVVLAEEGFRQLALDVISACRMGSLTISLAIDVGLFQGTSSSDASGVVLLVDEDKVEEEDLYDRKEDLEEFRDDPRFLRFRARAADQRGSSEP